MRELQLLRGLLKALEDGALDAGGDPTEKTHVWGILSSGEG
jgi:hypothetical protein